MSPEGWAPNVPEAGAAVDYGSDDVTLPADLTDLLADYSNDINLNDLEKVGFLSFPNIPHLYLHGLSLNAIFSWMNPGGSITKKAARYQNTSCKWFERLLRIVSGVSRFSWRPGGINARISQNDVQNEEKRRQAREFSK